MKNTFLSRLPLLCVFCLSAAQLSAQANFRVEIASDTVARNQPFQVRYVVENADVASFQLPFIEGIEKKNGPSTSRNVSIINGKTSQTTTFTYWLVAPELGQYELPKLEIPAANGQYLSCQPQPITVTEDGPKNKNNLPQASPFGNNPFGSLGQNPFGDFGAGFPSFEFPDFPQIDVQQFFNNPQLFNFEFPNIEMPQMPNFDELFKERAPLMEQQFSNPNAPNKKSEKPKIDPKTNQPVYKI